MVAKFKDASYAYDFGALLEERVKNEGMQRLSPQAHNLIGQYQVQVSQALANPEGATVPSFDEYLRKADLDRSNPALEADRNNARSFLMADPRIAEHHAKIFGAQKEMHLPHIVPTSHPDALKEQQNAARLREFRTLERYSLDDIKYKNRLANPRMHSWETDAEKAQARHVALSRYQVKYPKDSEGIKFLTDVVKREDDFQNGGPGKGGTGGDTPGESTGFGGMIKKYGGVGAGVAGALLGLSSGGIIGAIIGFLIGMMGGNFLASNYDNIAGGVGKVTSGIGNFASGAVDKVKGMFKGQEPPAAGATEKEAPKSRTPIASDRINQMSADNNQDGKIDINELKAAVKEKFAPASEGTAVDDISNELLKLSGSETTKTLDKQALDKLEKVIAESPDQLKGILESRAKTPADVADLFTLRPSATPAAPAAPAQSPTK